MNVVSNIKFFTSFFLFEYSNKILKFVDGLNGVCSSLGLNGIDQ